MFKIYLAILSVLFFSQLNNRVENDYIQIEYVGDSNHPMPVIWISKKPIPWSERIVTIEYDMPGGNYLVHNNEFVFIKNTITSTTHKTFEEKDYNGFKITLHENDSLVSYFITRKNSNLLFFKANAYLKSDQRNKELILALTQLRLSNVVPEKQIVRHL
jgi:hypothetical protein